MATGPLIRLALDPIGAVEAAAVMTCETMTIIFYIVSARR